MAALVEQGMRDGAVGLSSGLEYEVGGYGETSELVELAKVAARHGGIYMSHIRDEADKSFEALREAIAIGEQRAHPGADLAHQARHRRRVAQGGRGDRADRVGAEARRRCHRRRLSVQRVELDDHGARPRQALRLSAERREALADVGGAENVLIVRHAAHPEYEFKTLEAVAQGPQDGRRSSSSSRSSRTAAPASSAPRWWTMTSSAFYEQPWVMVASDGGIGVRHPRGAGTFPRVLGKLRPRGSVADSAGSDPEDDQRPRRPAASSRAADGSRLARSPTWCCSTRRP